MVKSVCFFQNRNKLIAKWIVSGCQIFLNLACSQNIRSQNKKFQNSLISSLHSGYASDFGYCILGVHHGKSLVPAFVEISVDGLFDNFGKSWISHPKNLFKPFDMHCAHEYMFWRALRLWTLQCWRSRSYWQRVLTNFKKPFTARVHVTHRTLSCKNYGIQS